MAPYQQFPIYDFKSGVQLNKSPWLLPKDAFVELQNIRVFRGLLQKRYGYSLFAKVSNNPIAGIYQYTKADGTQTLTFWDTRKFYTYDAVNKVVNAVSGLSDFTGDADSTFWAVNWKDQLFFTNNADRLSYYDGSTIDNVLVDIDEDTVNELTTCKLVLVYHGRLIVFNTTEDGNAFPQRARWSSIDNPHDWTRDEYVDAPTNDVIISADFIGDTLYVFFDKSIWALRYTQNSVLPFRWERVSSIDGGYAKHARAAFSDRILTTNGARFIGTDGIDTFKIDQVIPDAMLNVNPVHAQNIYSYVSEEFRETYWAFTSRNSDTNDRVLVNNLDDGCWMEYTMPVKVFGFGKVFDDLTWDDVDLTWDELEQRWDARTGQAGFPLSLFGDYDGNIFYLDSGGNDDGQPIDAVATSADFAPFSIQGQLTHLGYADILISTDADITLTFEFYVDEDDLPYVTYEFALSGSGTREWHRIYLNAVSENHRFKIKNSAANQTFEIHAIVLYAKPGGMIL